MSGTEIERIRQWRDETRPIFGPGGSAEADAPDPLTTNTQAWWRDIDTLLTELDQVPARLDWMWRDHQCQRPDLEAVTRDLIDPDDCDLDHHGYCQTHGWLQEGECPHARAKALLARPEAGGS